MIYIWREKAHKNLPHPQAGHTAQTQGCQGRGCCFTSQPPPLINFWQLSLGLLLCEHHTDRS